MTRGAALWLALGIVMAALLHGGIWEYGDGFIFNRFTGGVIYVHVPDENEMDQAGLQTQPSAGTSWFRRLRPRSSGG